MLCAGAAAQGCKKGLNFFVWNFAWDRLASRLYAATATPFHTWRYQLIIRYYKLLMFDNSYWPSCIWVTEGLTHWGRLTHICVCKLVIIASHNGLSPGRRQAIIWTNAAELLIRALGTNFTEFLSEIYAFSFKKKHLKMASAKWRPFCLGLNELMLSRWTLKSHTSWISCLWLKKRAVI